MGGNNIKQITLHISHHALQRITERLNIAENKIKELNKNYSHGIYIRGNHENIVWFPHEHICIPIQKLGKFLIAVTIKTDYYCYPEMYKHSFVDVLWVSRKVAHELSANC